MNGIVTLFCFCLNENVIAVTIFLFCLLYKLQLFLHTNAQTRPTQCYAQLWYKCQLRNYVKYTNISDPSPEFVFILILKKSIAYDITERYNNYIYCIHIIWKPATVIKKRIFIPLNK